MPRVASNADKASYGGPVRSDDPPLRIPYGYVALRNRVSQLAAAYSLDPDAIERLLGRYAPEVADLLAAVLGWTPPRRESELAAYRARVDAELKSQQATTDDAANSARNPSWQRPARPPEAGSARAVPLARPITGRVSRT